MKTTGRKIVSILDETVNFAVLAVFVLLFLFGAYVYWDSGQIAYEADLSQYAQYKPTEREHLTFSQLCQRNPDVLGWLTVDNTKIDYPLVQGKDNAEYINLTVEREFSLSGSLFLDYRNNRNMQDRVSVIYGHHMDQDNMFGCLDRFGDKAFFDAHLTGNLFYEQENHSLHFFAFLHADGYDSTIYAPGTTAEEFQGWLNNILSLAEQKSDQLPNSGDRVVLLSTCASAGTNGRMILAATIGEGTPLPEDAPLQAVAAPNTALYLTAILLGIALVLLVILLIVLRRRRRESDMDTGKREKSPNRGECASAGEKTVGAKPPSLLSDIAALLIKIGVIAGVFYLLCLFVFGLHSNSGVAMQPAIRDRDMVVYYQLDKDYSVRDVIVLEDDSGALQVLRVVAVAGDSVDITSEGLRINGYLQQEGYANGETLAFEGGAEYPITISDGEVFVLGDNREHSVDSRFYGPVRIDDTKGKVIIVIRRRDI